MSLAGFDFQALNRKYLQQPANDAANYGASIVSAPAGDAWRCIGIYHLKPSENKGRHNVFVEVLDPHGDRIRLPHITWTWWIDAPTQTRQLDKPDNEPAADITIDKGATITLQVADGLPSDSVGNLHARHNDEGSGNTWGHHSFYVVFQLKRGNVATPPVEPQKPPILPPDNGGSATDQRLSALEAEVKRLTANQDALWKVIDNWQAGK